MPPTLPTWLDLSGQVAIVTGGGTHLGRAMATSLAELGSTVYLIGRREEVVAAAAEEMRADGFDAHARRCDAADEEGMQALVDGIIEQHGRLDTAVCNAGNAVGKDGVPDIKLADFEATIRAHVGTSLVTAQTAARAMIPAKRGSIVTVGSIHGSLGSNRSLYVEGYRRSSSSYHASKGAILNLTRSLATELSAHGITVNCISPGQFPKARMDEETRDRQRAAVPLGRLGVPDDLKAAMAMFACEGSRWTTGQNLVVDGGYSAW